MHCTIWVGTSTFNALLYTTVSKPEFGIVGLLGWCNPASEALQVIGTSRVCGIQSYPCIAGRRIKTVATKIYRVFSFRWTFPHSLKVVSSSGGYLEGAQLYYLGNSVRPRHKVGLIALHPLHHCATHPSLHILSYFYWTAVNLIWTTLLKSALVQNAFGKALHCIKCDALHIWVWLWCLKV